MDPQRHARIQQIFEAAVDLPPTVRDPYLRETCGDDDELLRRVEQLIFADRDPADREPTQDLAPNQSVKVCQVCARCYDGVVFTCPADGTPLEPALAGPLLIDRKYLIERRLGHGGMGAVYQVRHTGLEKTFALKLILADGARLESYRESFETEARALGALQHPNIVGVSDYGIDPRSGGIPYLVMEYLEGETLRQHLKKRKTIPFPEAAPMLRSIAAAIDAAHAQNIIHADLKPGNLFLARQPDASVVMKVVDFGLARLTATRVETLPDWEDGVSADAPTVTLGPIRGTPAYMAPELFRAEAPTRSSDRFAFGMVAYEMLTGDRPFGSEGNALPPSSQANLPPELDAPLLALLDPAPERRPRSAIAAVDAMEDAFLNAQRREWRAREVPRRMGLAVIAAMAAGLVAAVVALLPFAEVIEDRIVDARFSAMHATPPDPRLMVVTIDDASLALDPRPLTQWSETISATIERMFDSGAHAVAIDVLLPASWSTSPAFTKLLLHHADRTTLAIESRDGAVIGPECVALPTRSLLGDRYDRLFGFVNQEEDQDHAIRHARTGFPDLEGRVRPSFAGLVAGAAADAKSFWIDYSVPPQSIARISYKDAGQADVRDRVILLGSTFTGSNDDFVVPARKIPGVVLQAEIANSIMAGLPVRGVAVWISLVFMGLAAFLGIALALRYPHRPWISLVLTGGVAGGYLLAAFLVARAKWMIPVFAPELALVLAAGVAWILRVRLSPYPKKGG